MSKVQMFETIYPYMCDNCERVEMGKLVVHLHSINNRVLTPEQVKTSLTHELIHPDEFADSILCLGCFDEMECEVGKG